VPSPRHWFWWTVTQSSGNDIEVSDDDAENAAVYLADFIRAFSDLPISGIMLVERADCPLSGDSPFACYTPVFNVTKHYRWPVVLRLPAQGGPYAVDANDVALAIGAHPLRDGIMPWAVDVSAALWSGQNLPELGARQILNVDIPADEVPEKVLDYLKKVRALLV
jgi:hypothetical protein